MLLEAMRSAVGHLLEQSVEWGRIEAANQERRTAMRTNKVRRGEGGGGGGARWESFVDDFRES